MNKPGGIQKSKIQEKYVGGTGAASNSYVQPKSNPLKPNFATNSSVKPANSKIEVKKNAYEQPKPSNSSPFGGIGKGSKQAMNKW